ncbi:hypothetical protein SAMN05421788_101735 [Filimonas lacunae]|uniref:Uncharacterized protein n=2 Tax=Filimonas lacunae TaxID=477680 RepID=A0A173MNT0_9BACT|nr:hypothetical protein FLA_5342 [Filimonas lacunae]SIS70648.1 hypothetical protein SAMN05421788_101735 [Filimonas lacunae]
MTSPPQLLPFILTAFFFAILTTACKKQENNIANRVNQLTSYNGNNASVEKMVNDLEALNSVSHFSDSVPAGVLINWDQFLVGKTLSDSVTTYVFQVRIGSDTSSVLLVASRNPDQSFTNAAFVRNDTSKSKSYFSISKQFNHTDLSAARILQPLPVPQIVANKTQQKSASRDETCTVAVDYTYYIKLVPGQCSYDVAVVADGFNNYWTEQMRLTLTNNSGTSITVYMQLGAGMIITGPVTSLIGLNTNQLNGISTTLMDNFKLTLGNGLWCQIAELYFVNFVVNNRCIAPPEPPVQTLVTEDVMYEYDEVMYDQRDFSVAVNGYERIHYSCYAKITRDASNSQIQSVTMYPVAATPASVSYVDYYSRECIRIAAIQNPGNSYSISSNKTNVNLTWSCLAVAEYSYSDGTPTSQRQWNFGRTEFR